MNLQDSSIYNPTTKLFFLQEFTKLFIINFLQLSTLKIKTNQSIISKINKAQTQINIKFIIIAIFPKLQKKLNIIKKHLNILIETKNSKKMDHEHGPNCGCKDYMGVQNANDLISAIDIDKVTCLNEQVAGSGRSILKEFDSRFDKQKFVRSDCDGEILLVVPFVSQVKIRSICVIAKGQTKYPTKMGLYVNNENINFSLTEHQPVQQFPLNANLSGQINHAVKISKFKSVHKLIIHLKNENQENIEVSYLQIKGENTNIKRQAVQTVYEIQPNAQKKDLKDLSKMGYEMH